jgi:hypothetical protein
MRLRTSITVALLSITALGQNTKEPSTGFKPKPAKDYLSRQVIGKLTLAAAKFETDEETRQAFGKVNPNEYGALPVLLVLQNDGGTLMLDKMRVRYQMPDGTAIEPTPASQLPYLIAPKRPNTGPKYPVPIPGIGGPKKNPLTAPELDARSFDAKTLLQGEEAHGFFYFQTRHRRGSVLYVSGIREAATGKEIFFAELALDSQVQ